MNRGIMLSALFLVVSMSTGCGLFAPKAPAVDRPYSGFMDDYQPLNSVAVQEKEFIAAKGWIAPEADLSTYRAVIVDPIKVDRGIQQNLQITTSAMTAIRQYMSQALTHKLEEYYPVDNRVNGRALRARVAITGLETQDEPLRFYEYWPSALAFTSVAMLIGTRDEDIYLFVEAEFLDAQSNEVVAKTMVGMVGHERLENEWEELTLEKVKVSIDQWIEHQVTALKQEAQKTYFVSNRPLVNGVAENE